MSHDLSSVEVSLLIGTWDTLDVPSQDSPENLVKLVVNGDFRTVLLSSHAREVFKTRPSIEDAPLEDIFNLTSTTEEATADEELTHLALAVACLHTFIQANWTGPSIDVTPSDVLTTLTITEEILNRKAISELAYNGEPAYHLALHPTFLRLAQILLALPYNHCPSAAWWRLRTTLVHQQVLDQPVAVPPALFASLVPLTTSIASNTSNRGLAGRLELEIGLLDHLLTNDHSAAEHFVRAAKATGLEYELTGALGKRTKFQQSDLSQLVLLAQSHLDLTSSESANNDNTIAPGQSKESRQHEAINAPETLALHDDTLLEQTHFTASSNTTPGPRPRLAHIDPAAQPTLHPLDQCILLSLCLNVKNTSPSHGLTTEQMSPYVARVISHPENWSVHTMALFLRSRLESSRTRTVERATLQLQALVDQMPTADSTLPERLLYFHSLLLPSKWEMECELALRFLSLGVVKSAMEIFERLEMWEEVVKCWQALENREKAIAIVRDLLEGRKEESDVVVARGKASSGGRRHFLDSSREAKLWCLLGDLEPDQASVHYARAWSVSKETSGRAMKSLGALHFARGEFPDAITCLSRAVSINPLLSRSWFILGCAHVRQEDWEGARDAFSRCVAIDEEDGESWNNLATVYLRMGMGSRDVKDVKDNPKLDQPEVNVSFSP
jgi:tetratricopeptide (TPR) repeat protein